MKLLTRLESLLLLALPSSFWGACAWCFWSCCIIDSEASLKDPGNLLISFWASACDDPDLSLRSSDNILLLAATKPDIVDKSPPIEIFGASSWFFPAFAHAARWVSGPEWEALLCWWTGGSTFTPAACDGLGGSMGKPEATSSGWGLNFSLLLWELACPCLFCKKRLFMLSAIRKTNLMRKMNEYTDPKINIFQKGVWNKFSNYRENNINIKQRKKAKTRTLQYTVEVCIVKCFHLVQCALLHTFSKLWNSKRCFKGSSFMN